MSNKSRRMVNKDVMNEVEKVKAEALDAEVTNEENQPLEGEIEEESSGWNWKTILKYGGMALGAVLTFLGAVAVANSHGHSVGLEEGEEIGREEGFAEGYDAAKSEYQDRMEISDEPYYADDDDDDDVPSEEDD